MAKRKKRVSRPLHLWWNLRDQLRFIESTERFEALVNDLEALLAPKKRQAAAKAAHADAVKTAGGNGEKGGA